MMGAALAPILWMLLHAEGCGRQYEFVESVSFSPDGSRILVTNLTAKDANASGKIYKANVARTISLIDVTTRRTERVHEDFRPGNCGPALHLFRPRRMTAAYNSADDSIVIQEFGGGAIELHPTDRSSAVQTVNLNHDSLNIALSKSGNLLAASYTPDLSVWDTMRKRLRFHVRERGVHDIRASVVAFSPDESLLATLDEYYVQVDGSPLPLTGAWAARTVSRVNVRDTKNGSNTVTFDVADYDRAYDIDFFPDNTLLICSDKWVRRYDLSGNVLQTVADAQDVRVGSVSDDGRFVAVAVLDEAKTRSVRIFDLCERTELTIPRQGNTWALAFSPDGRDIVHAGSGGIVTSTQVSSGKQNWSIQAPGRRRGSPLIPAVALVLWCLVALAVMHRRSVKRTA